MRKLLVVLGLLATAFVCITSSSVAVSASGISDAGKARTPAQPDGVGGRWRLKFDEPFNGTELNLAKWSFGVYRSYLGPINSYETENYSDSRVQVKNGSLRLSVVPDTNTYVGPLDSLAAPPGRTEPYLSGAVTTAGKESFIYGFFEARIFVPGNAQGLIYNWPAWWLTSDNWPKNGEIDIFEGLSGNASWHFHYGAPSMPLAAGTDPKGRYTNWHVFGADWEPGSITYYYDGQMVGTIQHGVTSSPLWIVLDLATGGFGGKTVAPSTMRIDYVRVWEH